MPKASATRSPVPEEPRRHQFACPLGHVVLTGQDGRLTELTWSQDLPQDRLGSPDALLADAERQITAYFGGRLRVFDLPLGAAGTAHQTKVWNAIAAIPFGASETYGSLARKLGSGARAVGSAAGANPIPIIVPCHRVLAAGGTLGGYSGSGGLEAKRFLLRLEGVLFNG
jgi:methylated-DNA-[protein]-cysteine S-methyltransferase